MGRSVLLLANRAKPDVLAALDEVRSLVNAHGKVVAEMDANGHGVSAADAKGAELIVVLGGDGTLMGQSRRCVHLGLPMLGVNLGKLGFMAEFDLAALRVQAKSLFDGSPLNVQDRPMLRATLDPVLGSAPEGALAHNDVVITAGPPYRMITMAIKIDGTSGPSVTGDGLIISTPIGSTAYNASAGGAIISPEVEAMALTPMAAHSLAFRPVVVPAKSVIEIVLERVNDDPGIPGLAGGTALVLDGQVASRVHAGQRITIRRDARPAKFVRNPQGSYWTTLIGKLRWGAPPVARST